MLVVPAQPWIQSTQVFDAAMDWIPTCAGTTAFAGFEK
jgi:hypothetical protein